MTPFQLLTTARSRLSLPSRWTRHAMARDSRTLKVEPWDSAAICWCIAGALTVSAVQTDEWREARALLIKIVGPLARFNDDPWTTHEDVLAVFDRAIQEAA